MKKQILFIALAVMGLTACKPGGNTEPYFRQGGCAAESSSTLCKQHRCKLTYSQMADAGMTLMEKTEAILAKVEAGQDYADLMVEGVRLGD